MCLSSSFFNLDSVRFVWSSSSFILRQRIVVNMYTYMYTCVHSTEAYLRSLTAVMSFITQSLCCSCVCNCCCNSWDALRASVAWRRACRWTSPSLDSSFIWFRTHTHTCSNKWWAQHLVWRRALGSGAAKRKQKCCFNPNFATLTSLDSNTARISSILRLNSCCCRPRSLSNAAVISCQREAIRKDLRNFQISNRAADKNAERVGTNKLLLTSSCI